MTAMNDPTLEHLRHLSGLNVSGDFGVSPRFANRVLLVVVTDCILLLEYRVDFRQPPMN